MRAQLANTRQAPWLPTATCRRQLIFHFAPSSDVFQGPTLLLVLKPGFVTLFATQNLTQVQVQFITCMVGMPRALLVVSLLRIGALISHFLSAPSNDHDGDVQA